MARAKPEKDRRSYGTGSLYERPDSKGRVTLYGQFYANGRRVKRRIGLKRTDGATDGLTHPGGGEAATPVDGRDNRAQAQPADI